MWFQRMWNEHMKVQNIKQTSIYQAKNWRTKCFITAIGEQLNSMRRDTRRKKGIFR